MSGTIDIFISESVWGPHTTYYDVQTDYKTEENESIWPDTIRLAFGDQEGQSRIYKEYQQCHDVGNHAMFVCSECGCGVYLTDECLGPSITKHGIGIVPAFCPNCGREVS